MTALWLEANLPTSANDIRYSKKARLAWSMERLNLFARTMKTPKYLILSTQSSSWPCSVLILEKTSCLSHLHWYWQPHKNNQETARTHKWPKIAYMIFSVNNISIESSSCSQTHRSFCQTVTDGAVNNKKLSWCWQQARRVQRSVEVNKYGTIPHVTYSFLLCNSNFVFKTRRRFYDSCLQKISWPWNGGQRSLKVIESDIIR